MKPRISIIAAMAKNRVIGVRNTLPWYLPEDLKHFKALTLGHHLLMGRKTFESIGKPLPGRTTIIITRNSMYRAAGCRVVNSIDAALSTAQMDNELFFVGGADLYQQVIEIADRLYLTEIQADFVGDAWFPLVDATQWRETERTTRHAEADGGLVYDFAVYDKQQRQENA